MVAPWRDSGPRRWRDPAGNVRSLLPASEAFAPRFSVKVTGQSSASSIYSPRLIGRLYSTAHVPGLICSLRLAAEDGEGGKGRAAICSAGVPTRVVRAEEWTRIAGGDTRATKTRRSEEEKRDKVGREAMDFRPAPQGAAGAGALPERQAGAIIGSLWLLQEATGSKVRAGGEVRERPKRRTGFCRIHGFG